MKTLFDISQDLINLIEQLETLVEYPDDQEQAITKWFHELEVAKQARDYKIDILLRLNQRARSQNYCQKR